MNSRFPKISFWSLAFGFLAYAFPAVAEDRNFVASDYVDICLRSASSEEREARILGDSGWRAVTPSILDADLWWDGNGRPTVEQIAMIAIFAVESLGDGDPDAVARRLRHFMTYTAARRIAPLADNETARTFFNEDELQLFSVGGLDRAGFRKCYYVGFSSEPDESLVARYGQEARIFGSLAKGSVQLRLQPETNSDALAGVIYTAFADKLERGLNISLGHLVMFNVRQ